MDSFNDERVDYVVVGVGDEWDPNKSPRMERKVLASKGEDEVEEIHYVSIILTMPLSFQIVHAQLQWEERWYPPGKGSTSKHISRAQKGDNTIGHGKNWYINAPSGEKVSIYFSPTSQCLTWKREDEFDPTFQMPTRPIINDDSIWAATQFRVNAENDPLCKTLLTALSIETAFVIFVLHLLPYVILVLLFIWVSAVAKEHYEVNIYKEGMRIEWANVIIIYFCVFAPKGYETVKSFTIVREVLGVAKKIQNNSRLVHGLRFAAAAEFINLSQSIFALGLSYYIALFLSENIFLNVVLNMLALEFVASVDEAMIAVYIKERFGEHSVLSFVLVDLNYAEGIHEENDFWNESQLSKSTVLETLKFGEISNDMRWSLLLSIPKGLGLLGVLPNNRDERRKVANPNAQCVSSVEIEFDILNWDKIGEAEIITSGGLFLSATNEFVWENIISKQQKGILFKYSPELAQRFPWKGCVKMSELGLDNTHAPYLAELINSNKEVVEIDLRGNTNIGSEGVKVLTHQLKGNKRLRKLSFHLCDIDNIAAKYIGELFEVNTALEYVWLLDNKRLGDDGALSIMKSLSDDENNNTLCRVYMNGTSVSEDCKEKCKQMTKGRMDF